MIFEKVRKIIAETGGCDEDDIAIETTAGDLGIDSLDIIELILEVEDEFDIELPDDEVRKMTTVGDLVEYIRNNP